MPRCCSGKAEPELHFRPSACPSDLGFLTRTPKSPRSLTKHLPGAGEELGRVFLSFTALPLATQPFCDFVSLAGNWVQEFRPFHLSWAEHAHASGTRVCSKCAHESLCGSRHIQAFPTWHSLHVYSQAGLKPKQFIKRFHWWHFLCPSGHPVGFQLQLVNQNQVKCVEAG